MKNVIIALQQLLRTAVENSQSPLHDVKNVYFGDPYKTLEADLPAIAIQPIGTDYIARGSRYDEKVHTVEIRVIYNEKQYFDSYLSAQKNITGATYSGGIITFTSVAHGLVEGDKVTVEGTSNDAYNGTYLVASADSDAFTVDTTSNPGTYTADGFFRKANLDKVFAIEDAINKMELTSDYATSGITVCGVVQKNMELPYTDSQGNAKTACQLAKITRVSYSLSMDRGFPTFETIATVQATVIGDR